MTNVLPRRSPTGGAVRRRRVRRRRVFLGLSLLLVVLGAFLAWLGLGLLHAARDVKVSASAARDDLATYRTALQNGDTSKAAAMLTAARGNLAVAHQAADRTPVSIGYFVPVAHGAVADLRHLLKSADIITGAGTDALDMYKEFSNHQTGVFHDSRFDLASLSRADTAAHRLVAEMAQARRELVAVHGGIFEPGVLHQRDSALAQVDDLDKTAQAVVRFLGVLPDAVGATAPKSYVIAVMNPAELRFSGGAPLSLALATFDQGRMTITNRGQTSDLTHGNELLTWTPVPGDPWLRGPVTHTRLATATLSSDWPTAGEELLRAYQAAFGIHADGAIALDPLALAQVLRETGPMEAPGYGQLTAANLVPALLKDAYQTEQNTTVRHSLNDTLMSLMISRLTQGGELLGKGKALAAAAKGRHFQLYFRSAPLEAQVLESGLGGVVPRDTLDTAGVYTQNTNASKVDYFQQRSVQQVVQLHADGSADVTRTITIRNATPPGFGIPGTTTGYLTGVSTPAVMTLVPIRSGGFQASADGTSVPLRLAQEGGHQALLWARPITLQPGGQATLTLRYHLPAGAARAGADLAYSVSVPPQATVSPETFTLRVVPPTGWLVVAGQAAVKGVSVTGNLRYVVRLAQK